ncbi:MAG TPA: glycosyltransferase family 87 protein, partial [Terriglobales bacterium]|nr:glycosyltransferase family 87 protein [Terriglobales bacterium]
MFNLRAATALLVVILLLIYGAIFFQLRRPLAEGYSDFISFYTAGKILQRGAARQLYDLRLQYEVQREVAPEVSIRQAALPFVRPPFEAWLFLPFAYLPYKVAFVAWNLLSGGCLLGITLLLRKESPQLQGFSLAFTWLAIVSYFPVFVTILQGQDSIVLLGIYVIAYILLS